MGFFTHREAIGRAGCQSADNIGFNCLTEPRMFALNAALAFPSHLLI
jgi:hypothetical protein